MNCLFDDYPINLNVKPLTFIQEDNHGYFIDVSIKRSDVLKLLDYDILPIRNDRDYKLRVRLNHRTTITINGMKLYNFHDLMYDKPTKGIFFIKELILKKYSDKTERFSKGCYATKLKTKLLFPKGDLE